MGMHDTSAVSVGSTLPVLPGRLGLLQTKSARQKRTVLCVFHTVTHCYNHALTPACLFCTVRRGRSPTITPYLGMVKRSGTRGWEHRGRLPRVGASTRGGGLCSEGGLVLSLCPLHLLRGRSIAEHKRGAHPLGSSGLGQPPNRPNTTATTAEVLRDRGCSGQERPDLLLGQQHRPRGSHQEPL